ncbi:golvesin C-terminal-like domain-containing protein [Rathayibacter sp. CAU 1779]
MAAAIVAPLAGALASCVSTVGGGPLGAGSANAFGIADLHPSPTRRAPALQLVLDNEADGVTRSGFDSLGTGGNREQYAGDYRQSGTPSVLGQQWVTWTPTIPVAGRYRVFMKWSSFSNRPTGVPVTIASSGGAKTSTAIVNQQINARSWYNLGVYTLTQGTGNSVHITDAGGDYTVADAVKFIPVTSADQVFTDDFSDGAAHWIEQGGEHDWQVVRHGRDAVYRHSTTTGASPMSWLHVFEKDVDVSASFTVLAVDSTSATAGLVVRHHTEEALTFAGYDFASGQWVIREQLGGDFDVVTLAQASAPSPKIGRRVRLRVTAVNNVVDLYVNGSPTPLLTTDKAENQSSGRIALNAAGARTDFETVEVTLLSGQGRIEKGVLDVTIGAGDGVYREGATVVPLKDGTIAVRVESDQLWKSKDGGRTFAQVLDHTWPVNPGAHSSIIRLANGQLLNMIAEYATPPANFDSPLRYRAMRSSDEGATWVPAGLTWEEYREGPVVGQSPVIAMNDKLTQISTGRIFYPVELRSYTGTAITAHATEIWYSDDNGDSWAKTPGDSGSFVTGIKDYCESKIVETTSGDLELYTPYNETPSLRVATSHDGGMTWTDERAADGFMNARSSFSVAADTSGRRPEYFMVWVYDDQPEDKDMILPRNRLALATSSDGVNWRYAMDVDRWVSPYGANNKPITTFIDPGLTVTPDWIYVTSGRSERYDASVSGNPQQLRFYRIARSAIRPYEVWPAEY